MKGVLAALLMMTLAAACWFGSAHAQSGCCNETCTAAGFTFTATMPLAPKLGGGYKVWPTTTVGVYKDNNPPSWFQGQASSMLADARAAWDRATCLTIDSSTKISFMFVASKQQWDDSGELSITVAIAKYWLDGNDNLIDVQILVNCAYFVDDDWNDDDEATWESLTTSPIDGQALFTHEIGHGLGLWAPEIGGPGQQTNPAYKSCTLVIESHNIFGDPRKNDIDAICCGYNCPDDDPAAGVLGFSVVDGMAEWTVESEFRTASYSIQGGPTIDGPWSVIDSVNASRRGRYQLDVSGKADSYFRLVETETPGKTIVQGRTKREARNQKEVEEPRSLQSMVERFEQIKSRWRPRSAQSVIGEELWIYTNTAMQSAVQTTIADYWAANGYSTFVEVVPDVGAVGPDFLRTYVEADISLRAQSGANYFLLVGDAVDWQEFHETTWPAPWDSIQNDYLASGNYNEPSTNNIIPTFSVWDLLPRDGGNMSWWTPYWFTDMPYADQDDDGRPDVVVTRLPFRDPVDVYAYGTKLWAGNTWNADQVVSLVEDTEWITGSSDGFQALAAATEVESGLPVWVTLVTMRGTDHPVISARNTATANFLNTEQPELLLLIGARSNKYFPVRFLDKFNSVNPWTMSMLTTTNPFFVVGASCGTAGFARSEYGPLGTSVVHDFLAEPDKGAVVWIGPAAGTWQRANRIIASYIVEELYQTLRRPGGESFRIAIDRVLSDYSGDPQIVDAATSYVFLGDPLIPFWGPSVATAVLESPQVFDQLGRNWPNPFNPVTTIDYSVAREGRVRIAIYDVSGALVRLLVNERLMPDRYRAVWDGRDHGGNEVASGVYFYRLSSPFFNSSKKMVLIR